MGLFSKPTREELEKKIDDLKDRIDREYDSIKAAELRCTGESLRLARERHESEIAKLQDKLRDLEHDLRHMS